MTDSSPLIPPSPVTLTVTEIDLEEGSSEQIQCRICLETDGRNFIAPCKCKGTSKYVHRGCLDHWRAVKEGYAFAHCTTCKAPYHLRVHDTYRNWRTFKFRFFVTRDILFIFLAVQLVIASLAYLAYLIDGYEQYRLRLVWGFGSELSFYYICGVLLFFVLLGLSGCFITCSDPRVRNDLGQPCRELCLCCCQPGIYGDRHLPGTPYSYRSTGYRSTDCNACSDCCGGTETGCCGCTGTECCGGTGTECCGCTCMGGSEQESGLPLLFIMALIFLVLFAVIGIFYSVLVATMVGQRIWQRHYHILAKTMLTKEYVVESIEDGEIAEANWTPPPLPPEHVRQLKTLDLL